MNKNGGTKSIFSLCFYQNGAKSLRMVFLSYLIVVSLNQVKCLKMVALSLFSHCAFTKIAKKL
jgi:hypothetical protein